MLDRIVKQLFCAVDSHNWSALSSLFHPEIVYERPGYAPLVGRDEVLHFYREERMIASGQHHIEQIVEQGNCAVCWGAFVGVVKNGSAADARFADVYVFAQGQIIQRRTYFYRPAV